MVSSARETALAVLERCRRNQAFSDVLLDSAMRTSGLDSKDRALCTRLCYGVIQNRILCDYYIDHYLGKGKKLEPKLRDILRLSAYQLIFMDKIPARAAVSEGVSLCEKHGLARAKGLANAILRRLAENRPALPELPSDDPVQYLSILYSTPEDLVSKLIGGFGAEFTGAFLASSNASLPLTAQVNTLKITPEALIARFSARGISVSPSVFSPDCLALSGAGDLNALPEHTSGLFYVQDAAARLSVMASGAGPGDRVLDACAAPGGKSFAAAIRMENTGSVLACDSHENKLGRVRAGAERLGISIIDTAVMDASVPPETLTGAFDLVLADVPCSGLGVIRKKPDIRYKALADIARLPEVQLAILNGLSACVKPGGVLLYSTCTILPEENGGVADRFLAAHPGFEPEGFTLPEPFGRI
ncbi:MAG: 16S rRNA (cytosine(967)-C(5))-methyltransferase RsmB, partial [Oscillospiraceae bacterium]|nr:16S rRNA (cytosine(967)-C(5))-methyltransferase RsmB [Oscillospiraceae bacterium]